MKFASARTARALCLIPLFVALGFSITVTTTNDGALLANSAVVNGELDILSVNYTGAALASGTFTDGPFQIGNGTIITTGRADQAPVAVNPPANFRPNVNNNFGGSPLCQAIIGNTFQSLDATTLSIRVNVSEEFTGITTTFIFATEEFPEYVHLQKTLI